MAEKKSLHPVFGHFVSKLVVLDGFWPFSRERTCMDRFLCFYFCRVGPLLDCLFSFVLFLNMPISEYNISLLYLNTNKIHLAALVA